MRICQRDRLDEEGRSANDDETHGRIGVKIMDMCSDDDFFAEFLMSLRDAADTIDSLVDKSARMRLIDMLRDEGLNDSAILDTVYALEEPQCEVLINKFKGPLASKE